MVALTNPKAAAAKIATDMMGLKELNLKSKNTIDFKTAWKKPYMAWVKHPFVLLDPIKGNDHDINLFTHILFNFLARDICSLLKDKSSQSDTFCSTDTTTFKSVVGKYREFRANKESLVNEPHILPIGGCFVHDKTVYLSVRIPSFHFPRMKSQDIWPTIVEAKPIPNSDRYDIRRIPIVLKQDTKQFSKDGKNIGCGENSDVKIFERQIMFAGAEKNLDTSEMLCYNFPIKTNRGDGLLTCDNQASGNAEYDSRNWLGRKMGGIGKLFGKGDPPKVHDIYGSLYIFPDEFSKAEYELKK